MMENHTNHYFLYNKIIQVDIYIIISAIEGRGRVREKKGGGGGSQLCNY